MPNLYQSGTIDPELNAEHLVYLEKLIHNDNYLDTGKMLKHIGELTTRLAKESTPLMTHFDDINAKLMAYARKNTCENVDDINDPDILDDKLAHLRRSIESMRPVYEKKVEASKILVNINFRIFLNEIKSMSVKGIPLIASGILTFVLDTYTPFLEKLIPYPTAHTIFFILSFIAQIVFFDKLFDKWKEKIIESQILRDMRVLKQCYTAVYDVNNELNRLIIENPMPEIFQ